MFYDYDEIEYLVDCRFRRIPSPPPGFDEMSGEVWYPVGARDIFPEEFATFLLTDARVRAEFEAHHRDLLDASWWQQAQRAVEHDDLAEVLSYPARVRLVDAHAPPT